MFKLGLKTRIDINDDSIEFRGIKLTAEEMRQLIDTYEEYLKNKGK